MPRSYVTIRLAEALLKTAERRSSDMVESSDDEIQRGLTVRQSGIGEIVVPTRRTR